MNRYVMRLRTSQSAIAIAAALLLPTSAFAQAAASPHTTAMRYDAADRPTGSIAPDPDGAGGLGYPATRTTYDASGRVTKVETGELASWQTEAIAPANWAGFTLTSSVETSYDALDRKIQTIGKGSDGTIKSAAQFSYDGRGLLTCSAQRMNFLAIPAVGSDACVLGTAGSFGKDRITRNNYDVTGQLLKIEKAVGTPIQQDYATYTYTTNGKPASVKDANGNLATYVYDGQDRQTRWNFPSKTTVGQASTTDYEEYTYDANVNRTSLRKRDGSVITYQYDALNRNTLKIVPERAGLAAAHTRDVYFSYDLRGLQTSARFDSASGEGITTAYDGFGRMSSSTLTMDGVARQLTYDWDKNGNRIRVTHPDSVAFYTEYDGLNRFKTLYEGASNGTYMVHTIYNARDAPYLMQRRFGNYTSFYQDSVGRLNESSHVFTGGGGTGTWLFGYNPASQMTSRTVTNDSYVWTGAVNVSRNYGVNGLNQYTSAGPATFTYDPNGNLTGDGTRGYVYDVENRLVKSTGVGAAAGAVSAALRYDPLGRVYETTGAASAGAAGVTRFHYDGDELVGEYDAAGAMRRRYVHGAGVDDPVLMYEGASVAPGGGSARHLHANWQGSIIAVANSGGAMTAANTYDEYGIPGSANQGRFQYTGQAWIPELGMYYYKARIYSPTLGRFLQTDPIGYKDQINLYAYVGNDPVNMVDSSGKCKETRGDACVVRWSGGPAEKKLAQDLANKLTQMNKSVMAWADDKKISLKDEKGNSIGTTTGAEMKSAWKNHEWQVVPTGTTIATSTGNVQLGKLYQTSNGFTDMNWSRTSLTPSAFAEGDARSLGLHEFSHAALGRFNTVGRSDRRDYEPRNDQLARSLSGYIDGTPYDCGRYGCKW